MRKRASPVLLGGALAVGSMLKVSSTANVARS
jgi:hypothetical protein